MESSNSAAEMGISDPEIATVVQHAMGRVIEAFTETFERAKTAGELAPGTDSRGLATMVVATFQGIAVIAQCNPDPTLVAQALDGFEALLSSCRTSATPA